MLLLVVRIVQLNKSFSRIPNVACANTKIKYGEFTNSFEDATNHVRVVVSPNIPLEYGMCFKLDEVEPIENKYYNPGSFDYQQYMRSRRIIYNAKGEYIATKGGFLIKLKRLRQSILTRNCETALEFCPYVNALLFGENQIDNYAKTIYGQIGIAPIFAISGMHITLIYELIIYWLSKLKVVINRANVMALVILLFYSVLAGSSVAINRALIMIGGKLLFKLKSHHSLLMALVISLLINPYNLLNSGYLLSYCLTCAIIVFPKQTFTNNKLSIISFSALCYLISLPLSYHFNYTFNLLAPIAMLGFTALITTVVMPLALIVTIYPLPPVVFLLRMLIKGLNNLAEVFNLFTVVGGSISLIMWLLYIVIVYQLYKQRYKFYLVLVGWFVVVGINYTLVPTVTFVDVGQGDSAVIEFGTHSYLIDSGDQVNEIVKSARYLGVNKFDGAFISHAHEDHYGALSELSRYVEIEQTYEYANSKIIDESIGISQLYQDRNFTIIPIDDQSTNNRGLIIKYKTKYHSVLFTGDIEVDSELKLAKQYCQTLDSDIIKVPHHGSQSSSSDELLKCVSPQIAVISSGRNNRYHHPDPDIVEKYQQYGLVYNTQIDGQVSFKLGNNIKKTSN